MQLRIEAEFIFEFSNRRLAAASKTFLVALQVLAVLVFGLMCGSELNVAAFGHPTLNRQSVEVHIPVRSSLAALFGRVMPFWMAVSTLLNLLLLLPFERLNGSAWHLAATSFAIQAATILFSLVAPVPINNRIAKWTPATLPEDRRVQERRWDRYHWFRTCGFGCGVRNSHS